MPKARARTASPSRAPWPRQTPAPKAARKMEIAVRGRCATNGPAGLGAVDRGGTHVTSAWRTRAPLAMRTRVPAARGACRRAPFISARTRASRPAASKIWIASRAQRASAPHSTKSACSRRDFTALTGRASAALAPIAERGWSAFLIQLLATLSATLLFESAAELTEEATVQDRSRSEIACLQRP